MWWKKRTRFWKTGFRIVSIVISIFCLIVYCLLSFRFLNFKMPSTKFLEVCEAKMKCEQTGLIRPKKSKTEFKNISENDYDLPVDVWEKEEAESDCKKLMQEILPIYKNAEKGEDLNVTLQDADILKMQDKIKEKGNAVTTSLLYSNLENYEEMDHFLKNAQKGKTGSALLYTVYSDGGIGRMKYYFDGTDLYVLHVRTIWNEGHNPGIAFINKAKIKQWKYTKKGWFCYELCVKEPPEVTEIVDGSCLIRIKPMTKKYREMSIKYVKSLGYKGNNLLCSNWDRDHMENIDYNGVYEYFYEMKHHQKIDTEKYANGIPGEEFERLIMEYLPVTKEQIRKYGVYNKETKTYTWIRLGCFNYTPSFFGTSVPEVTKVEENEDGTITLTVDAVCSMILCDDAVITHELTIEPEADGSFIYLGNKILEEGIKKIPDYQYRVLD